MSETSWEQVSITTALAITMKDTCRKILYLLIGILKVDAFFLPLFLTSQNLVVFFFFFFSDFSVNLIRILATDSCFFIYVTNAYILLLK